jgi:uncharacterized iron-regulated protein
VNTMSGAQWRISLFSLPFFLLFLFSCACAQPQDVIRLKDKASVSWQNMAEDIKKADVVFVGETHDDESSHRLQLEVIKSLNEEGVPIAVGLEMFTAGSQAALDAWISGKMPVEDFVSVYYANWNFPWPLYRDIFLYLREHDIPAIGLNLPPEITRKVAAGGFASLTEEERKKLPPETGCIVNKEYMDFIRRAYSMHGHGDRKFVYFCEAQLLWDQTMARNISEYLKRNPGKTVVVLTGSGHAWKRGMPYQLNEVSPGTSYRVLLPARPGNARSINADSSAADYILLP